MPPRRYVSPPLRVDAQRYRPLGPVRDGYVHPFAVVPGAEHPWVRMGSALSREEIDRGLRAQGLQPRLGALGQEEIERGQMVLDRTTGEACVVADPTRPFAVAPWYVNLRPSGSRGVPLSSERPLQVRPMVPSSISEQTLRPSDPTTNVTRVWPQLYPPGKDGGERPRTVASASVNVAAGATVSLITLAELGRGIAAVVKKFGQTANDFTNLVWSFIVKGGVVEPISGISFQFGQMFLPVDLPGTGVQLLPGDDFVVQVQNTGAVVVNNVRARVDLYEYRVTG